MDDVHLATNVLGSFVVRNGKIIKQKLFAGDPKELAEKLAKTRDGVCEEERELIEELQETGNQRIEVDNPARFLGKGIDITFAEESKRIPVYWFATEMGLPKEDVDSLMYRVNRAMTRALMREVERDQLLIQAVNSLDDIDEAVNRLIERLREWYSLHFPELDELMSSHEGYARIVSSTNGRGDLKALDKAVDPDFEKKIVAAAKDSLGVDFTREDLSHAKALAQRIIDLYDTKKDTESYIGDLMDEIAPNTSAFAGPLLGARLISLAHGLKRMASLPAGTIQILGAEDAFFRFLKSGKKPPKHGIIFQYPDIRSAKRDVRGKLARTFAAKLAIAVRADAYGESKIAEKLKADFQKRVKSLS